MHSRGSGWNSEASEEERLLHYRRHSLTTYDLWKEVTVRLGHGSTNYRRPLGCFQTVETWYRGGRNAKDTLGPHGAVWLMSFPVASCPCILLGSGSLSPGIAIGRLDIERSLALFLLAQFRWVPNKMYTTEAY